MKQLIAPILVSLMLLIPLSNSYGRDNSSNLDDPGFQQSVLDTLSIQQDGTLSIDINRAKTLLGSNFDTAMTDLDRINFAIKSGQLPKFNSGHDLYSYKIIRGNNTGEAQVFKASTSAVPSYCRGGTCTGGMCCCQGWWIFCWRYCSC